MVSFLTNIAALKSQTKLNQATKEVTSSYEKLASGLRINTASDDAAGLAISSKLNLDKRVNDQGVRNINDGISLLTIADSAISSLSEILTRIQELAAQGANGSYNSTQRNSLQQETSALESEYNRILQTTTFNGKQVLTGDNTQTVLQGGYGTNGQLIAQVGKAAISPDNLAGGLSRESVSSAGGEANGQSGVVAISSTGRYVLLSSAASNLVSGDVNGVQDVFLRDTVTGQTTLISRSSADVQGNNTSWGAGLSDDGRYIAFWSSSSNLVSGDTNGNKDVFLRDTTTDTVTRLSTDSNGNQGNNDSEAASISQDGRFVSFNSFATNLVTNDTNVTHDVFVKNVLTGQTTRASTDSNGTQGNGASLNYGISGDGRYVLIDSAATNLVSGDSNGVNDVFVKDLQTGQIVRASTDSSGTQANGTSYARAISADGRYVLFDSIATNLVSGDSNAVRDVFIKDLITGETKLISSASDGTQSNAASFGSALSADGRFAVISINGTNVFQGDTNGFQDVIVKDVQTGAVINTSVDLSGNQGNGHSYGRAISADGRRLGFDSAATNLITGDTNGVIDSFVRDLSKAGVQEISGVVVSNQVSARVSLGLVEGYQQELSLYKAGIGASLSRASVFVRSLQSSSDQSATAASRITDVDVAEESANLIKKQILQQAATSILAQSNQQPSLVLSLLASN